MSTGSSNRTRASDNLLATNLTETSAYSCVYDLKTFFCLSFVITPRATSRLGRLNTARSSFAKEILALHPLTLHSSLPLARSDATHAIAGSMNRSADSERAAIRLPLMILWSRLPGANVRLPFVALRGTARLPTAILPFPRLCSLSRAAHAVSLGTIRSDFSLSHTAITASHSPSAASSGSSSSAAAGSPPFSKASKRDCRWLRAAPAVAPPTSLPGADETPRG